MTRNIMKKLVSAVLSSAMAIGIMVVIVEDGHYDEMPYYEGSFVNPINTPYLDALYRMNIAQVQTSENIEEDEDVVEDTNGSYNQYEYSSYNPRAE